MSFSHPISKKAPSFDSETYWEERFAASPTHFEWLASLDDTASILQREIGRPISEAEFRLDRREPSILHIGCGTSELSLRLRDFVRWPSQVHNVDFSQRAVDHGRQREKQCSGPGTFDVDGHGGRMRNHQSNPTLRWMRWSKVDLLSLPSVLSLVLDGDGLYRYIIDKSTSDSIACGDQITINSGSGDIEKGSTSISLHPVQILALHLAAVTITGGRWIAISYSAERFWFLMDEARRDSNISAQDGAPEQAERRVEPSSFWRLERKEEMAVIEAEGTTGRPVHRPKICNWLYVLVRTTVPFPNHELLGRVDRENGTNDNPPS